MSYFMSCQKCGKETIGRYATEDSLCGECSDNSSTKDKLSVEKLIEKEIKDYEVSYKISGRRSENYIAGILEGLKIARAYVIDSLSTDEKTVEKLQEQLNTAKKYIEHVIGTIKHDGHLGTIQTDWILPDLEKALEVIGGNND